MHTVGLVFPQSEHLASLKVGGISVLERQVRQLRAAGVARIIAVDPVPLTVLPGGVEAMAAGDVPRHIDARDRLLLIAGGLLIDGRAIAAVLAAPVPTLLVDDATRPGATGIERLDALAWSAGLLTLTGRQLRDTVLGLGDWDFFATVQRSAAAAPGCGRIVLSALPLYVPALRRDEPMLWLRPETEAQAAAATDRLIAASQKGCLDWPARFLHPPVENALVRLLAPTAVTPNMVTLFGAALALGAGWAFATGALWPGLVVALICGPIDGVDGKLARLRQEFSRWGDLEHALDKVLEYGWYLCIAGHFAAARGNALPWALAALIIVPALAEAVQGEFFRRLTGRQLDDAGRFERRWRLVAGRRNTFLWTWAAFALAGQWFVGFAALAVYSVLTAAVAQWRFYHRLAEYGRDTSATIAANLLATGYAFLPRGKL